MPQKKEKRIKTEWDLSILYESVDDKQIDRDISNAEKAYKAFAKKYNKSTDYLKNENALILALKDFEKINDTLASKPYFYLYLSQDVNSKNEKVRAKMNLVTDRLQKLRNLSVFFTVNLSKVALDIQKKFLLSKKLKPYRYLLEITFKNGKHTLSEAEEKILALKYLPAHSLWVRAIQKLEDKLTVLYNNKKISIPEAHSLITDLPTQKERVDLSNKIMDKYFEISDMAESEMNAIVIDKKIEDELRGFSEPHDATVLSYENEKETVKSLTKTVTDNFKLVHKFYKIKAKMLKLKKLNYADRGATVGKNTRKLSFTESYKILCDLFEKIDIRFAQILQSFVLEGRIDVYPKIGKRGGAYSFEVHGAPGFVMLNHTDSMKSLSTFAHEMGHAIHTEFSKTQPVLYENYTSATAETASTLFESFLFYDQFINLSDKEKIVALHDKIQDDVSTIFRQIAFFNFELEIHKTIREKGNMSKVDLAKCMNKHMQSYMGDAVKLEEIDGYFFVGLSHIRRFFYVYSYAFGQLASKALYKKYSQDKTYIEKIKQFLSAGGSMSPEDIFKSIGIDVKKPDFWKLGIKSIKEDIDLLEKMISEK